MNDMEYRVAKLTEVLSKQCNGQGAAVVIGASLNMIMTAAQAIPDKDIRGGLIICFRKMADDLEKQNASLRQ